MKKSIFTLAFLLAAFFGYSQNQVTYSKDVFGNTIATDQKGNQGTYSKDVFGNIIYTPKN